MRDLTGRLAVLAYVQNIDLKEIFSFPLLPIPLSMASSDETILNTDTFSIRANLERKIDP